MATELYIDIILPPVEMREPPAFWQPSSTSWVIVVRSFNSSCTSLDWERDCVANPNAGTITSTKGDKKCLVSKSEFLANPSGLPDLIDSVTVVRVGNLIS